MSLSIKENIENSLIYNEVNEYFYVIKYPPYEESLCHMEMKYLFSIHPEKKYFFSSLNIKPSRSPFIKKRIAVMYKEDSLHELVDAIVANNLAFEQYKVGFVKIEDGNVSYEERMDSVRQVGNAIIGEYEIQNPAIRFAISKVDNKWIFGLYEKNDYEWHEHDNKPYTYSHSLSLRVAKALVNIAVGNDLDCKLVDPCCGVGTVVIEALSIGIDVKGYEINRPISYNAKRNVEYFGYENVIKNMDMHDIEEHFDTAIIDIPYGIFIPITLEQQQAIIHTARRIADKLVIVTFEDMDEHIKAAGFEIVDRCYVTKGNFKRYISICK